MKKFKLQNLKLKKYEKKYFWVPLILVSLVISMFIGFVYVEKNTKKIAFDDFSPIFNFEFNYIKNNILFIFKSNMISMKDEIQKVCSFIYSYLYNKIIKLYFVSSIFK